MCRYLWQFLSSRYLDDVCFLIRIVLGKQRYDDFINKCDTLHLICGFLFYSFFRTYRWVTIWSDAHVTMVTTRPKYENMCQINLILKPKCINEPVVSDQTKLDYTQILNILWIAIINRLRLHNSMPTTTRK